MKAAVHRMANSRTALKGTLAMLVLIVVGLAGGNETVAGGGGDFQTTMAELRAQLESNAVFEREEPFSARPFDASVDDKWIGHAVAYGCYRAGQAPGQQSPSDAELLEDLQIIAKHWSLIRVYGADKDSRRMLRLIDEHSLPLKVLLGIWLSPEEDNAAEKAANVRSTLLGIELASQYPDIVVAVSVGNETQVFWSGHRMTLASVVRYIRAVRKHVNVPVTTADDYLYWNKTEAREMATEVDFIFTHIHPLWNGKTLDSAIAWMDDVYRDLHDRYPDREIVIGETGWATDYDASQTGPGQQGTLVKGEVGLDAQAAFLRELKGWVDANHVVTFWFEVFDESWKGGGASSSPSHIEKHWGVFYESRQPKESFSRFLSTDKRDD